MSTGANSTFSSEQQNIQQCHAPSHNIMYIPLYYKDSNRPIGISVTLSVMMSATVPATYNVITTHLHVCMYMYTHNSTAAHNKAVSSTKRETERELHKPVFSRLPFGSRCPLAWLSGKPLRPPRSPAGRCASLPAHRERPRCRGPISRTKSHHR